MLVRRLAITLFFVAAGALGQAATPIPAPANPSAATTDAAKKTDESKTATGADGTKAPNVTIDVVVLPPQPESAKELKARVEKAVAHEAEARLGDSIILVSNKPDELKKYVDWASSQSKDVTLYINGNDTGTVRESFDPVTGTIQFRLQRTSDNKKLWSPLLRRPFENRTRPRVKATIGIDHGAAAPTNAHFMLVVVRFVWYAWVWIIMLIAFLSAFFVLAKKYGLLRDGPGVAGGLPPYSLGLCQMAWWFILIIVSYVMIWLISGDQETITPSLLGLMGISAGTALGAALIEASRSAPVPLSQTAKDRLTLQAALTKAQQDLATARASAAAAPTDNAMQKAVTDAQATVDVATQKLNASGWLREILSDSNGNIALHRFQIVVWTIVLGIMFLVSVVTELTMPEFSATLLATMGISSATYLGFKFPEK